MTVKFKKSLHHPRFYLLCLLYVVCIADILFFGEGVKFIGAIMLVSIAIPQTAQYLGSYTVTDEDILKGNGTVYIQNINKLVYQKDRVDVYYLDANTGKTKFKAYFPIDKHAFVRKLKEVNSDIQVV